mmetsp:Transcript_27935/g.70659  ORF Transcript_27935/g.70659 Transcript_27935/m.70659 type:complete len:106 (-) Transcript_27935:603-920(-)
MEWRNSTDGEGKGKLFFAVNGEMDNCDGNKNAECELDASEKSDRCRNGLLASDGDTSACRDIKIHFLVADMKGEKKRSAVSCEKDSWNELEGGAWGWSPPFTTLF